MMFDTSKYEAVHANSPRGHGHWAFILDTGEILWIRGQYFMSKLETIAKLKNRHYDGIVTVGS